MINNELLHAADRLHTSLDAWTPPGRVRVYQIVGTGVLTTNGFAKDFKGKPLPTYTLSGDGVVQDMYDTFEKKYNRTGVSISVDLHNTKFKHVDIMNNSRVLERLHTILRYPKKENYASDPYVSYKNEYTLVVLHASNTPVTNKTITAKTDNEVITLHHNTAYQFDTTTQNSSLGRYDVFDTDLQYLHQIQPKNISIQEEKGGVFDLSVFTKNEQGTQETIYTNVHLFKNSEAQLSSNTFGVFLPTMGGSVIIPPTSQVTYNQSHVVTSVVNVATTTEDILLKINRIQESIQKSNMTMYLKKLYISRFKKITNYTELEKLRLKIHAAIADIDRYAYSPTLKARYAKTKESYMFMSYISK